MHAIRSWMVLTVNDIHSLYAINCGIYYDQSVIRRLYWASVSSCHQVVRLLYYVQLPYVH